MYLHTLDVDNHVSIYIHCQVFFFTSCLEMTTITPMGQKKTPVFPLDIAISRLLRNAAQRQGKSLRVLSMETDISHSRIGEAFRGIRALTTGEVDSLCSVLGLTPWMVLKEAEEAASALDTEEATANVDTAGVPRRLSVVDGGHAASAPTSPRHGRAPSLSEIEQANGNMA